MVKARACGRSRRCSNEEFDGRVFVGIRASEDSRRCSDRGDHPAVLRADKTMGHRLTRGSTSAHAHRVLTDVVKWFFASPTRTR